MDAYVLIPALLGLALVAGALVYFLIIKKKGPKVTTPPIATAGIWTIAYSPDMPSQMAQNSDGFFFDFPTAKTGVHYVYTNGSAKPGQTVTLKYSITGAGELRPAQSDDTLPCKIRLFLQRRGDNLSGAGDYEWFRFWATETIDLAPGDFTLSVPLTYDRWTGVYGKSNEAGFASCLADLANMGFTFGGASFAGHGVYVSGGQMRFTLREYSVQ